MHRFQRRQRVELRRGENQRGAIHHRYHRPDDRPETMIERHRRANAIRLIRPQHQPDRHAVVDQAAVREHDALGQSGGPRCVLNVSDVVGRCVECGYVAAVGDHLVPGGVAQPDDVLEGQGIAITRFVEDLAIIRARVLLPQKQRADMGLFQDVSQFVRAVRRVDVDQHHPGARGGMLHEDPLHAVARPDAGAVARAQSKAGQSACRARDLAIEFAPGEANILMADHQRVPVGKAGSRMAHRLRNSLFQQGHVGPADIRQCGVHDWPV